jgi:hypothetical protein
MRRVLILLALAACGKDAPTVPQPNEYIFDCENLAPDAGTFASDENWDAFVNAEAAKRVMTDAAKAPVLTAPASGTMLSAAGPPTFTFSPTPSSARRGGPGCPAHRRAAPSLLARLIEGTAEAHCGAFTGENYVFRLSRAGESQPVYLAVLSVTSFTPNADQWKVALAGRTGQTLTMTIERAVFFKGDISDGPYLQPTPWSFGIGP